MKMKTVSVKLPPDIADRAAQLKKKTNISESALLAQAIVAGLGQVERGIEIMRTPVQPVEVAA
jgi:predicted transcriptional regulator